MSTTVTPPLDDRSEESRLFLQDRVARMGLVGAAISASFLVFRAGFSALNGYFFYEVGNPSFAYHALAFASLLALWLACRTGVRSFGFIRAAEYLSLLGASCGYAMMGYYIPLHQSPQMIVVMAAGFALVARAVYIPSTAKRTIGIGLDVATPPLVIGYLHFLEFDPEKWAALDPIYAEAGKHQLAMIGTAWSAAWWAATICVCAAASHVVYGLRKEAASARKLGQYTLDEKLGEGGMGVVYKASHAMLRRPTAVKLVPREKAGERALARFEREVQLTAILTHPNTVTVFDYGRTPDGVFYYAMEYLDGATLSDVVDASGPMAPARVVHVLTQAAGALQEAHGIGLIHRDIKPANVMLVEQGGVPDVAKVLDFGLVKELAPDPSVSVTKAEVITGTPQYMSPEAIRDATTVDARSDLYALGAVGYFMLTGKNVFEASSVVEVCSEHLHGTPVPPSEKLGAPLPADLEELLMQCLAKAQDDRPQSAAEFARRLREVELDPWTEERAREWWEAYGEPMSEKRAHTISATDATLDVDMALRGTLAS